MIDDALDGPRLAELFLAEIVGRDLGPLGHLAVDGLEHPARFACEAGEAYTITSEGDPVATVTITAEAVIVDTLGEPQRLKITRGGEVKSTLDELLRSVDDQ